MLHTVRYSGLPDPVRTVRPYSQLSYLNLFFLQELARRVEAAELPGDFVECGVYRGGSAGVLGAEAMKSRFARRIWLYDSFAGMPAASEQDDALSHEIRGQFVGSVDDTKRILGRLGVPADRYRIVVGFFADTLPTAERPPIALLHIDCDFYDPVKLALETFYPVVQKGGYVVLNDYGYFLGCRTATDEFLALQAPGVTLQQIDSDAYFFQRPTS